MTKLIENIKGDKDLYLMHADISNQLSATLGVQPERIFGDMIVHWKIRYDPKVPGALAQNHVANVHLDLLHSRLFVSAFHPNVLAHKGFQGFLKPCIDIVKGYGLCVVQMYDNAFYDDACGCPSCSEAFDEYMIGLNSLKDYWDAINIDQSEAEPFYLPGTDVLH